MMDASRPHDTERKALLAIKRLQARIAELEADRFQPIAIIGLSCRYPGAENAAAFRDLLMSGREGIGPVPPTRWDAYAYYDPDPDTPGKMYARAGGFLSDIEGFDAHLFGIPPPEAQFMDPQHRLLLEQTWHALEHARIPPTALMDTHTGVFVGITTADYSMLLQETIAEPSPYYITGNSINAAAGRIAYTLGLSGPAMSIDTACSASLVAVHEACQSLLTGESPLAIAAGVNAIITPKSMIATCRSRMLSPDGRCKTFDRDADGYARGEGCGVLILKRLDNARRDGNRILGVLRGTAVNQNGRGSGFTVPSVRAQRSVITAALSAARTDPSQVLYLECHGTGTSLGDPIEVQAANEVYTRGRKPEAPLLIGSVKTNIGHLESAAGIAGIIKTVIAMRENRLPQHLNFKTPNPHIAWDEFNVRVTTEAQAWPPGEKIAGISSFGFSGTNAHAILAEPPEAPAAAPPMADLPEERNRHVLVLTARAPEALRAWGKAYADWLDSQPAVSLGDLCHSAAHTRALLLEDRASLVFADRDQLLAQLEALRQGNDIAGLFTGGAPRSGNTPRIGFLFTGQGSQYVGMGRELYAAEPVFRDVIDQCAAVFNGVRGEDRPLPLLEVMGIDAPAADSNADLLHQTGYTQPALFAIEVALAALWRQWGIEPYAVLGHSLGEFSAAVITGVFDVETGMKLVAERARLMQSLPAGGGMAAITGDAAIIEQAVSDDKRLCIGAYNGAHLVISGPLAAIDDAIASFKTKGLKAQKLKTSHAFHSTLMEPILEAFGKHAAAFSYHPARTRLISNVTGEAIAADTLLDDAYWTDHIRRPVRFAQGIQALQQLGCDILLEIGPHPVLTTMGQRCQRVEGNTEREPIWIGSLHRDHDDTESILSAAGQLFAAGVPVDFAGIDARWGAARSLIDLPLYPFQRKSFWVEEARLGKPASPTINSLMYQVAWQAYDPPPAVAAGATEPQRWLLIGDHAAKELARELAAAGHVTECADTSEAALALSDEPGWTHIVHTRALDKTAAATRAELQGAQQTGVHDLLDLTQYLCRIHWQGKLWIMTRATQRVQEDDRIMPDFAPMWGLGKSIGMERPEMWGGLIDLPASVEAAETASILPMLTSEKTEDLLAMRDGRLWVARLLPASIDPAPGGLPVETGGTYLITGGLGGIGLQAAGRLAARGAGRILLSSRRAPDEGTQQVIGVIEKFGCRIEVLSADVSTPEGVDLLLNRCSPEQPLRGVLHAAGVESLGILEQITDAELDRVLAAKVYGAWLLDQGIRKRDIKLDFFIATASVASVWGSYMQGAYAAANAYLDALAAARRSDGLAATAISFGPWAQVGMSVANAEATEWMRSRGISPLSPELALDAMETAAATGQTSTTIVAADWNKFRELAEVQRPRPIFTQLGALVVKEESSTSETAFVTQLRAAQPNERVRIMRDAIRQRLATVLGRESDERHDDTGFFDLGLDSLMSVEFRNAITKLGDRKFPVSLVYEKANITELAAYLTAELISDEPPTVAPVVSGRVSEPEVRSVVNEPDLVCASGYTVRYYRPEDRTGIIALIRFQYGDASAEIIEKTWEWKYENNPFNASYRAFVLVVTYEGNIVGLHGGYAGRLKLGDQMHPVLWGCDTLVHPDHRRASGLLSMAVDRTNTPLFLGTPVTRFYREVLEPGGETTLLETYARHMGILRLNNILRARGVPGPLSRVTSACLSPFISALRAVTRLRRKVALQVMPLSACGPEVDALWQRVSTDYGAIGVRDAAFLTWRFMQCPIHKYSIYGAWQDDHLRGYIVTRTGTRNGIQFGIIVDLLAAPSDAEAIEALLGYAVDAFVRCNVDAVECLIATHARGMRTALRRTGLFISHTDVERLVCQTKEHHAPLINAEAWYCTLADSDLDLFR